MPVLFVALPPMVARFLSLAVRQHQGLRLAGSLDSIAELTAVARRTGPALVFVGGEIELTGTHAAGLFGLTGIRVLAQVSTRGDVVWVHSRSGQRWELEDHTAPELVEAVLRILSA